MFRRYNIALQGKGHVTCALGRLVLESVNTFIKC